MSAALEQRPESEVAFHDLIDRVDHRIVELTGEFAGIGEAHSEVPLSHDFTPGLYIRTVFMKAGMVVTSKIHKSEHPYNVLTGQGAVYQPDGTWDVYTAPTRGVTMPGTRRLIAVFTDTYWVTYHANPDDETDPNVLEDRLFDLPPSHRLIGQED